MPAPIPRWRPPRPRLQPMKERAHYRSADWQARRKRILVRDCYRCQVEGCGRVVAGIEAHVDHRVPLHDGGTDDDANLQTLCSACHGAKTRDEQRRRGAL